MKRIGLGYQKCSKSDLVNKACSAIVALILSLLTEAVQDASHSNTIYDSHIDSIIILYVMCLVVRVVEMRINFSGIANAMVSTKRSAKPIERACAPIIYNCIVDEVHVDWRQGGSRLFWEPIRY